MPNMNTLNIKMLQEKLDIAINALTLISGLCKPPPYQVAERALLKIGELEDNTDSLKNILLETYNALSFYADKDSFKIPNDDTGRNIPIYDDNGNIARQALIELEKLNSVQA